MYDLILVFGARNDLATFYFCIYRVASVFGLHNDLRLRKPTTFRWWEEQLPSFLYPIKDDSCVYNSVDYHCDK
jgi:hypothetical protein